MDEKVEPEAAVDKIVDAIESVAEAIDALTAEVGELRELLEATTAGISRHADVRAVRTLVIPD